MASIGNVRDVVSAGRRAEAPSPPPDKTTLETQESTSEYKNKTQNVHEGLLPVKLEILGCAGHRTAWL